jgi:hypothetical protein
MNPIEDSSIILYHIYPQLSLKDAYQLSLTNQLFHSLFQKAIHDKIILQLSTNFVFKIKDKINTQYCKIIEYSTTKNTIKFRFVPYGRYHNVTWPILSKKILFFTTEVHHPQFISPQVSSLSFFLLNWEKVNDNSYYIYSLEYIHPLLYSSIQRTLYFVYIFLFLSFIFFIFFITILGFNVLFYPPQISYEHNPIIFIYEPSFTDSFSNHQCFLNQTHPFIL